MVNYVLNNVENIQNFLLGGHSDFIVIDKNTEKHINYRIKKNPKDATIYYITYKALKWVYLGYIKTIEISGYNVPIFHIDKKLKTEEEILKANIIKKLIMFIYYKNTIPENINISYTGKCSMCNRQLTDPIYIEIGIGKVCLTKF